MCQTSMDDVVFPIFMELALYPVRAQFKCIMIFPVPQSFVLIIGKPDHLNIILVELQVTPWEWPSCQSNLPMSHYTELTQHVVN